MSPKLLIVINDFGFFLSHRLAIAERARSEGYTVWVAAPGRPPEKLVEMGLNGVTLPLSRSGMNPLAEVRSFWGLYRLFRTIRPDLVHCVTIKPVLYGGIAARLARVSGLVSAISGLGSVFVSSGPRAGARRRAVALMYRLALEHSNQLVIVQNPDDRDTLVQSCRLRVDKTILIRGSGVDVAQMPLLDEAPGVPIVMLAARLLREKGVEEYVAAARELRARGVPGRFWLVGDIDPGNPNSVTAEQVSEWEAEGVVEVLGRRSDVPDLYAQAHIATLPSYYGEGLPKTLIEAAACGRAIVTTDHPGCRDAVEDGVTGVLVPVRDPKGLADALQALLQDPDRRKAMGRAGRALAEREFAVDKVVNAHLAAYRRLLSKAG